MLGVRGIGRCCRSLSLVSGAKRLQVKAVPGLKFCLREFITLELHLVLRLVRSRSAVEGGRLQDMVSATCACLCSFSSITTRGRGSTSSSLLTWRLVLAQNQAPETLLSHRSPLPFPSLSMAAMAGRDIRTRSAFCDLDRFSSEKAQTS